MTSGAGAGRAERAAAGARVVLLGPQRHDPAVGAVAEELGIEGAIATVTAGWQEREPDDEELDGLLSGRSRNLHLYGRWLDVIGRDPELAEADALLRQQLDEQQAAYLLRLRHALDALAELRRGTGDAAIRDAATDDALRAVAALDGWQLDRVEALRAAFDDRWRPGERAAVGDHRRAVGEALRSAGGVAIAGGHVAVLLHLLRLFDVAGALDGKPIVAWSAGAMALTDVVVLFHDHAVHAFRHAEVHDRGLGVVPGVVALPHAARRLDLGDADRMRILARRFAPSRCLLLDDGAVVRVTDGDGVPGRVVGDDGEVVDGVA